MVWTLGIGIKKNTLGYKLHCEKAGFEHVPADERNANYEKALQD